MSIATMSLTTRLVPSLPATLSALGAITTAVGLATVLLGAVASGFFTIDVVEMRAAAVAVAVGGEVD